MSGARLEPARREGIFIFDYMTIDEASTKWNTSILYVQRLCRQGKLPGAVKRGGVWFIPGSTENPAGREKGYLQFRGTKKKLFEAAIILYAERSYEAVTIKDIADAAGVTQSAVYNHFESKQEILDTIYKFFCHYFIAYRMPAEELEAVLRDGSLMDVLYAAHYDFGLEHQAQLVSCMRIIMQRMSFEDKARDLFKTYMLDAGLAFAEEIYEKAAAAGRIPAGNARTLSVLANMSRMLLFLSWLANPNPEDNQKLLADQRKIYGMVASCLSDPDRG